MGEQFWWFYDVLAVAAALVCVFLSGRKGLLKSFINFVGYVLAFAVAFSVSGGIAGGIYKNTIRDSNVKKVKTALEYYELPSKLEEQLGIMGYNVNIKRDKLTKILSSGKPIDDQIYKYMKDATINNSKGLPPKEEFCEQLHEIYGTLVKNILSEELSKYSAENAAREIKDDPSKFEAAVPLIMDKEDRGPASEYLADTFTEEPYKYVMRLIVFIILLVLVIIISIFVTGTIIDSDHTEQSIVSHICGGLVGVLKGAIIVFGIAAIVRLNVVMGSDEMLFFNHEAIDKTFIFRHAYDFIVDKF